jgi:hypothetical protein
MNYAPIKTKIIAFVKKFVFLGSGKAIGERNFYDQTVNQKFTSFIFWNKMHFLLLQSSEESLLSEGN